MKIFTGEHHQAVQGLPVASNSFSSRHAAIAFQSIRARSCIHATSHCKSADRANLIGCLAASMTDCWGMKQTCGLVRGDIVKAPHAQPFALQLVRQQGVELQGRAQPRAGFVEVLQLQNRAVAGIHFHHLHGRLQHPLARYAHLQQLELDQELAEPLRAWCRPKYECFAAQCVRSKTRCWQVQSWWTKQLFKNWGHILRLARKIFSPSAVDHPFFFPQNPNPEFMFTVSSRMTSV